MNITSPMRRDVVTRRRDQLAMPAHLSVVELRLADQHLDCRGFKTPVTGVLVGENPGPHTHVDLPMFPWPPTSSAGRLMSMGLLTPGEFLGGLYRRNLVDDYEWCRKDAENAAREMVTALFDLSRELRVVMLGSKVAKAFGFDPDFWQPLKLESRQTAVVVPHPSGLNRIYNDRACQSRTRGWMRWAALGEDAPR